MNTLLLFQILVFAFTFWLGLYLIARDRTRPVLVFTGAGLLAYAAVLFLDSLIPYTSNLALLEALQWPLRFAPALLWYNAAAHLLPEDARALVTPWIRLNPFIVLAVLYGLSLIFTVKRGDALYWIAAILVILRLLLALSFIWHTFRTGQPQTPLRILLLITLFFTLSAGALMLPFDILPQDWVLFLLGVDMIALGVCIGFLDAFDQGETFLPDFLRSFTISALSALIFGGHMLLAVSGTSVPTLPIVVLFFTMVAAAILVVSQFIQTLTDRLVFARFEQLRQSRAELRAVSDALPRLNESLDLRTVGEDEFARLTRRALSSLGNPGKLAASPLTRLPIIESRLAARGQQENSLERAAELKALLSESITRLKPRDKGDIGTSDEWRYYNALYVPYVLGIKPYARDGLNGHEASNIQPVVEWFRAAVPERTLHNWQNAAARVIAQDLREQSGSTWQ